MCDHRRPHRVPKWALPAVFLFCGVATVFGLAGGESRETITVECRDAHGGNLTSDGRVTVRVEVRRDQVVNHSTGVQVLDAPDIGTFEAEGCEEIR